MNMYAHTLNRFSYFLQELDRSYRLIFASTVVVVSSSLNPYSILESSQNKLLLVLASLPFVTTREIFT